MRRSSSTTRRCGASSAGGIGDGHRSHRRLRTVQVRGRRARSARAIKLQHVVAAVGVDHRDQEAPRRLMRAGPKLGERAGDPLGLQAGELHGQRLALRRDIEQALAAVVRALLLHHIALVDQLLEHAAERLLGDLQDVEQVGDLHARIAVDEMQHAVMRAAEAELGQHLVGVADEIAVGEEQQLDDVPDRLVGPPLRALPGPAVALVRSVVKFMSAILTYFGWFVTQRRAFAKGSCRRGYPRRLSLNRPGKRALMDRVEPYRDLALTQKRRGAANRRNRAGGPSPEEGMPWPVALRPALGR